MAHEAAYLSAIVDTTTKFLEALAKLPIRGDDAGNVAKHHPQYPRGQMYTRMFEAAEAMLATYRPMVLPAESTWETGSTWPLTALNAVNAILNETYGITFVYGKNSESGERGTDLKFKNRGLHDWRMAGVAHPAIPETREPLPEVDPRHIALVRTAVGEMRGMIESLEQSERSTNQAEPVAVSDDSSRGYTEAERLRLIELLEKGYPGVASLTSTSFWKVNSEHYRAGETEHARASEWRSAAYAAKRNGNESLEKEYRALAEEHDRECDRWGELVNKQYLAPYLEARELIRKVCPIHLGKLPLAEVGALRVVDHDAVARGMTEVLGYVLAMPAIPRKVAVETAIPSTIAPKVETQDIEPKVYLMSWPEILGALRMKSNAENKSRVKRLNDSEQHPGPIPASGQGKQPKVEKGKLLEWWNGLEDQFEQSSARQSDRAATVSKTYAHGRSGRVVPDIGGAVKNRRGKNSPPTS